MEMFKTPTQRPESINYNRIINESNNSYVHMHKFNKQECLESNEKTNLVRPLESLPTVP